MNVAWMALRAISATKSSLPYFAMIVNEIARTEERHDASICAAKNSNSAMWHPTAQTPTLRGCLSARHGPHRASVDDGAAIAATHPSPLVSPVVDLAHEHFSPLSSLILPASFDLFIACLFMCLSLCKYMLVNVPVWNSDDHFSQRMTGFRQALGDNHGTSWIMTVMILS